MKDDDIYFIAPLSNVDSSILGLNLMPGFHVEKWPADDFIELLIALHEGEDPVILKDENLYPNCCVQEDEDDIYVVVGKIKSTEYWKELPPNASFEETYVDRGGYYGSIKRIISLLRLIQEGQIEITQHYVYYKPEDPILSSSPNNIPLLQIPFHLYKKELNFANAFLKKYRLPFDFPYLQLAFENFDKSYCVDEIPLCFLTLMIAAEVLFNDGHQELKYRITRGIAVLLGRTYGESLDIYSKMRKLYDKRSLLVHTGRQDKLSYNDIFLLRQYLRESIRSLLSLNIDKKSLSEKLTATGFGDSLTSA